MKNNQKIHSQAFTRLDLLILVITLFALAGILIPALASNRSRYTEEGCLNNTRQLQICWSMYMDDNKDVILPNGAAGSPAYSTWNGGTLEGWGNLSGNTNAAAYYSGLLGPYVHSNLYILKCPGDVVPSANGQRLRSYSMNGQMGTSSNYNTGYRNYIYGSDLTCPLPANAFIFLDEHPGSINDGYFQMNLNSPSFPDVPAAYLEGGCGFSFADGHAAIHQWQSSVLILPVIYQYALNNISTTAANPDWLWLTNHASCHQ